MSVLSRRSTGPAAIIPGHYLFDGRYQKSQNRFYLIAEPVEENVARVVASDQFLREPAHPLETFGRGAPDIPQRLHGAVHVPMGDMPADVMFPDNIGRMGGARAKQQDGTPRRHCAIDLARV